MTIPTISSRRAITSPPVPNRMSRVRRFISSLLEGIRPGGRALSDVVVCTEHRAAPVSMGRAQGPDPTGTTVTDLHRPLGRTGAPCRDRYTAGAVVRPADQGTVDRDAPVSTEYRPFEAPPDRDGPNFVKPTSTRR